MKVKSKIWLGFGFLLMVVLFFGAVSLFYINQISGNTQVILKDNYESLNYCREMRTVLDEHPLPLNAAAIASFNKQLVNEEHNITEPGEGHAVIGLKVAFNTMQSNSISVAERTVAERHVRRHLLDAARLDLLRLCIVRRPSLQFTRGSS